MPSLHRFHLALRMQAAGRAEALSPEPARCGLSSLTAKC